MEEPEAEEAEETIINEDANVVETNAIIEEESLSNKIEDTSLEGEVTSIVEETLEEFEAPSEDVEEAKVEEEQEDLDHLEEENIEENANLETNLEEGDTKPEEPEGSLPVTKSESKIREICIDEKDKLSHHRITIEIEAKEPHKSSYTKIGKTSFDSTVLEAKEFEGDTRSEEDSDYAKNQDKLTNVISGFDLLFEEEEVEEESIESGESVPSLIDRVPYYEKYVEAMKDYGSIKRLNNFFQKKMGEYFKKRKMEHILRETEHLDEAMMKYNRKLEHFSELIEMDKKQREVIMNQLQILKTIRNTQHNEAESTFDDLVARELEIGSGLINSKTGKEIPEKVLEKLIKNQKNKLNELKELQLLHIKIRNAVKEKSDSIRTLDQIGETCTLIEYEQLKIENQGHADKIEERDEELARLRRKCQGAIQCLAHLREKSASVEINIAMMKSKLQDKEIETSDVREQMNKLKQQRDYYRTETQRLKEENGLLTNDKLLLDMENTVERVKKMEKRLEDCEISYVKKTEQLNAIKYNIEKRKRKHHFNMKMESILNERKSGRISLKLYKGRPTLTYPQFEDINKFGDN